jgi:uncharacterized protein YwgA
MDREELIKPVYKRQRFLAAFIKAMPNGCTMTDLQKLLFLYSENNNINFYDFIPYKFGSYSFQLAEDVDILNTMGWVRHDSNKIKYAGYATDILFDYSNSDFNTLETKRGDSLIRLVYTT